MSTDDAMLVDLMVDFATEVRMGNGVDIDVVSQVRRELEDASRRWSANGGVIPGATVGVLLSFYPALIGVLGLYDVDESHTIEILADDSLNACSLQSILMRAATRSDPRLRQDWPDGGLTRVLSLWRADLVALGRRLPGWTDDDGQ